MKNIAVRIEGQTPLLLNRFHEAAQEASTRGIHSMHHHVAQPEMLDAAMRLYDYDALERLDAALAGVADTSPHALPAENIRQACINAAAFHKIGRKQATQYAAAGLLVTPATLGLRGAWEVDTRAVVIPATKGRILRHRPIFPVWSVEFTMVYDGDLMDERLVRAIVDDAGSKVGIGDFRPARKGPYGRFCVVSWERD